MSDIKELKEEDLEKVSGGSVKIGDLTPEYKGSCCGQAFTLRGNGQMSYQCPNCKKIYALKSRSSKTVLCNNEEFATANMVEA